MNRDLIARLAVLTAATLILVACSSDDPSPQPQVAPTTRALTLPVTTAAPEDSEPATTAPEVAPLLIGYEVRYQAPGENGDVVVALIDPGLYTDIDLQTLLEDIVTETNAGTVHLIDSADITEAVAAGKVLDEALAVHYLAILKNGSEITFLGPFAEYGGIVIGS